MPPRSTSTSVLPPPARLGLPSRYSSWRAGQEDAVWFLANATARHIRFPILNAPTGSGKSVTYMTTIRLLAPRHAVILTKTLALQEQLKRDFRALGLASIMGQGNYLCEIDKPYSVAEGPCHAGVYCELKKSGCSYFDAKRYVRSHSKITVTTYAMWLTHTVGVFDSCDLLIMDEAHEADKELGEHLSATISMDDVTELLPSLGEPPTRLSGWVLWAVKAAALLEQRVTEIKTHADPGKRQMIAKAIRMRDLTRKIERLAIADESKWVVERSESTYRGKRTVRFRFDPKWPAPYAESLLFRKIPLVIPVSATIVPKTMGLLGVKESKYEFHQTPSTFPVARRPIIHVPTVRLSHRSTPTELRVWMSRIDQIIQRRLDRKGIIHCHSYARARFIYYNSRFRDRIIWHQDASEQVGAIERFRASPQSSGAILLSPSVTTGLDFPYTDAEYQIIAKVPFPDTRARIIKSRTALDPEYGLYLTMINIVQAAGRGMRAPDDQCETFIVDDQIVWFMRRCARFAPKWFLSAYVRANVIPAPPKPLSVPSRVA